ncbi:MAG: VOC family protein [Bacteroidetes bacterium]|nr:VOC family protein [Bacteroidota bacterium]
MLTSVVPKLPMRNKTKTKEFYMNKLGFLQSGSQDFDGYLMLKKDNVEIHFFECATLGRKENYSQVYIRSEAIEILYQSLMDKKTDILPAVYLQERLWGQKEFSILNPDNNLLTFGQAM